MPTQNILVLVDKNDHPIGTKGRNDLTPDDIYRVSALWLTNSRGDILLAQRALTKKNGAGKWGPAVAGTVEAHETYQSNMIKEADEEIGLKDIVFTTGPKLLNDTGPVKFFCQWFFATVDRPADAFVIEEYQVQAVAWLSRDQLMRELRDTPEKFLPGAADRWEQFLR